MVHSRAASGDSLAHILKFAKLIRLPHDAHIICHIMENANNSSAVNPQCCTRHERFQSENAKHSAQQLCDADEHVSQNVRFLHEVSEVRWERNVVIVLSDSVESLRHMSEP